MTTPPKPDHEKRPFRFKLEGPFLRVSTMLLITPISPNFKGLKCSVFGGFRALQSRNIYGIIAAENPNAGCLVSETAQPGDRRERARIARRKRGTIAAENPNAGRLVSETAQPGDRRERARIARRRRNDRKATVHFLRSSYRPQHGPQESGQKKGGNFR